MPMRLGTGCLRFVGFHIVNNSNLIGPLVPALISLLDGGPSSASLGKLASESLSQPLGA